MNKGNAKPPGLYANMNKRRAEGTSRPKSKSTVTANLGGLVKSILTILISQKSLLGQLAS
jgi:hypothetical protein